MTGTWIRETSPYPWPYDGRLETDRLALLICGADDGWAARCPADPAADAALLNLARAARAVAVPVISLLHQATGSALSPSWTGPAQPAPALTGLMVDVAITAAGIDGFYGSSLDTELQRRGRSHLLVAGRGFETTVHSTLRRANDRGYECLTVADACTAVDPDNRRASVSTIEMSGGIFGAVGTSEAVLEALQRTSAADRPNDKGTRP